MSLEVPSCSLLCDRVAVLSCCTPAPRLLHELEACPSPKDVGTVYGLSPAMSCYNFPLLISRAPVDAVTVAVGDTVRNDAADAAARRSDGRGHGIWLDRPSG